MNTVASTASAANPFPGLRSFEPEEATFFFGREEQCDHLLKRLAGGRMVAVVGASGSGKSSLVKAGLIPALESGYLPSAGTDWRITVCRPGTDPIGNLATGLSRLVDGTTPAESLSVTAIRAFLDNSSLGLVDCATRLLKESEDRLLVVIDQFEELFRFSREGGAAAAEDAAEFVRLLLAAANARAARVFVVITMRSDYLGDCGRFPGLPEALNDSQFLVPPMTRDQVKDAIEGPINVRGAVISARLVQRLLHDVEQLATGRLGQRGSLTEPDPLPLMQHAMMRVWDVSAADRAAGRPIDLPHYENPPVRTLSECLNLHAEEVFLSLSADDRRIAERAFRQLTERDPRSRDIRRPTFLTDLTAVALSTDKPTPAQCERIRGVLAAFAQRGRSFVFIDSQDKVDISHESLIRQWHRLAGWVEHEANSRRIFENVAEWAEGWTSGKRALYRGPELTEALQWVRKEAPTAVWAKRYGGDLPLALRYLNRSRWIRIAIRTAIGTSAVAIAILIGHDVRQSRAAAALAEQQAALRAEQAQLQNERARALDAAAEALNQANIARQLGQNDAAAEQQKAAYDLAQRASQLQKDAEAKLAAANAAVSAAASSPDRKELEALRQQSKEWAAERQRLQNQIASLQTAQRPSTTNPAPPIEPVSVGAARGSDSGGGYTPPVPIGTGGTSSAGGSNASVPTRAIPPSGNYKAIYIDAINARDRRRWADAERQFRSAASIKIDSGELIEMPGFGSDQPYLPLYNLGIALQSEGRCAEAVRAFNDAEQAGAIKKTRDYDDLKKRRAQCSTAKY